MRLPVHSHLGSVYDLSSLSNYYLSLIFESQKIHYSIMIRIMMLIMKIIIIIIAIKCYVL